MNPQTHMEAEALLRVTAKQYSVIIYIEPIQMVAVKFFFYSFIAIFIACTIQEHKQLNHVQPDNYCDI